MSQIPTMQGLQTALSGLMAYQDAMDVTGQNIANAQTPGYTRQQTILVTNPPLTVNAISPTDGRGAVVGTGVGVETIMRVRDKYLEAQERQATSNLSAASSLSQSLQELQSALHEPTASGVSNELSSYWSAWNSLADAPTSLAAREGVVAAGKQLAGAINELSTRITAGQAEASERYNALTGSAGEVATDAEAVAKLNGQIKLALEGGQQPNELLDRRESLVGSLSKLASTTVTEGEYGTITLGFGGGAKALVEGTKVNWPQALSATPGGELGTLASLASPTGKLASLREALDGVAEKLASSVNAHQPEGAFFAFTAGSASATLKVAVGASGLQTGAAGQAGANEYARAIAGLRGGEADTSYAAFVARIGHEVQSAQLSEADAEATKSAVSHQQQSISGVSVDEEMTSMLKLQRGYESSARVLTAMDQLLETLIGHTGKAGM